MSKARQLVSLLKSHIAGDDKQFLAVAMQLAAHEARVGHAHLARELLDLIDSAKKESDYTNTSRRTAVPIAQPRGELVGLLSVDYPETRLSDMVLPADLQIRLRRTIREQHQRGMLLSQGLTPRRKMLLIGPPGSGKTMTASALAGELRLPLFTILLEGLITKFLGETAAQLKLIFDAIARTQGVYLFDEFDAIGSRRAGTNDVGEIRRVLNSFLQLLERDASESLIVAATNHPQLLDRALFRRFDDVIQYDTPKPSEIERLLKQRLSRFEPSHIDWPDVIEAAKGLSRADIIRASDDAAKMAVLEDGARISTTSLTLALSERRATTAHIN